MRRRTGRGARRQQVFSSGQLRSVWLGPTLTPGVLSLTIGEASGEARLVNGHWQAA